jgi:hypothetical protein
VDSPVVVDSAGAEAVVASEASVVEVSEEVVPVAVGNATSHEPSAYIFSLVEV